MAQGFAQIIAGFGGFAVFDGHKLFIGVKNGLGNLIKLSPDAFQNIRETVSDGVHKTDKDPKTIALDDITFGQLISKGIERR